MKPVTEHPRSCLLIPSLIALLLTGTGCSMLIASRGVSSLPAITTGSTRQEVRQTLGDPESSETRGDGTRIETYRIRRTVESLWEDMFRGGGRPGEGAMFIVLVSPILEVYATGKAIYDSEKQEKFHVALVYGPEDRLLYLYDMNATPEERFDAARRPLTASQWKQLENDECPTWSACLTSYGDELRKRAALVDYTLPSKEEENVQRLLDVARDRDEGRITNVQALIVIVGASRSSLSELYVALRRQLEADRCPTWVACITFYADEVRRREASLDPPASGDREAFLQDLQKLQDIEEKDFERLLEIAKDKDEGRMTKEEALETLRRFCIHRC